MKLFSNTRYIPLWLAVAIGFATGACHSVQPYQRAYLNDHEMRFGASGANGAEDSFQIYREGASGGGSHSVSGGCGCN
ncbi:MAG: DUF4266 domain-containing protein [Bacteroidia bacterium]|nr:DUF4266 domain-containing protein [Bacteroidia bacterium]